MTSTNRRVLIALSSGPSLIASTGFAQVCRPGSDVARSPPAHRGPQSAGAEYLDPSSSRCRSASLLFDVSIGAARCMWKGGMIEVLVPEKSVDSGPRRRLSSFYQWLTGASSPSNSATHIESRSPADTVLPERIGHYAITRKLGAGAMGVVYAAQDERLGRTVALKRMSSLTHDETARKRFWREARAAASVNHPNVCQIYEIGEGA